MRYEHRAMAQLIAADPTISQNQLAEVFGYSASWISVIMSTGAFQQILAEEMEKSPIPAEARMERRLKVEGLLDRSVDILLEKLGKKPEDVPDQLALQTMKVAGGLLEMGKKPAPAAEVHVHLEQLGENLVGLLRRRKNEAAVEAEVVPQPEG